MAGNTNTTGTAAQPDTAPVNVNKSVNGGDYQRAPAGYKAVLQQVKKYDNTLLKMLQVGENLGYSKYLNHKSMPMHLGDVISMRRYFALETDPRKLKIDKNALTGPELKRIAGAAVSAQLEWYGNGIALNDYVKATHIDDLMAIYLPQLYKNAKVVKDNIAGLAIFDGASKVISGGYGTTAPYTPAVATSLGGAKGLTISLINYLTSKMQTNTETYQVSDFTTGAFTKSITVPAPIAPYKGGRYKVIVGPNGYDQFLQDPNFKQDFLAGITNKPLRENKVLPMYRFDVEEIGNWLTIDPTKAVAGNLANAATGFKANDATLSDGTATYGTKNKEHETAAIASDITANTGTLAKAYVHTDWSGKFDIAFLFGKDFGFDVKMAGQGLKVFQKTDGQADSNDIYGRLNFVTYKMAYVAKVANAMAVHAIIFDGTQTITNADTAANTPGVVATGVNSISPLVQ